MQLAGLLIAWSVRPSWWVPSWELFSMSNLANQSGLDSNAHPLPNSSISTNLKYIRVITIECQKVISSLYQPFLGQTDSLPFPSMASGAMLPAFNTSHRNSKLKGGHPLLLDTGVYAHRPLNNWRQEMFDFYGSYLVKGLRFSKAPTCQRRTCPVWWRKCPPLGWMSDGTWPRYHTKEYFTVWGEMADITWYFKKPGSNSQWQACMQKIEYTKSMPFGY